MAKSLYRRIMRTGLQNFNYGPEEIKLTKRSNFLALIVLFIIIPFIYIFWYLDATEQIVSLLLIGLSCFWVFWLNGRQKFQEARMLQIFLLGFWLFYYSIVFGYDAGAHYLFFVSLLMPFSLFKRSQQRLSIITAAIYFLLFVLLEFQWISSPGILVEENQLILHKAVMILVFIWLFINFLMYSITNSEAEQQLMLLANRLKFKNRETEQLIYITSHDLQEPLRSVSGFVELLKEDEDKNLSDEGLTYLSYISEGVERMHHLVLHLMDYTRLGENSSFFTIDLNDLMATVLDDLQELIQQSGAQITTGPLPVLKVDVTEMRLVFRNLLENAIKFRVEDRNPQIRIGAEQKDELWQFYVEDNGIGIDARFHDKIFSIFKRLHHRDKYHGHGVGLAQCKKIIELHGGEIWLKSEPGKGSVFYFNLPVLSVPAKDEE